MLTPDEIVDARDSCCRDCRNNPDMALVFEQAKLCCDAIRWLRDLPVTDWDDRLVEIMAKAEAIQHGT